MQKKLFSVSLQLVSITAPTMPGSIKQVDQGNSVLLQAQPIVSVLPTSSVSITERLSTLNMKKTYVSFKMCILFIHLKKGVKQIESPRQAF